MASGMNNPSMNWSARNLNEEWRKFAQHARLMFKGPLRAVEEDSQCAYMLIWVGETGRDIYNSWNLSEEDSKKIDILYDQFEKHTLPRKNSLFSRYLFQKREQRPGENFETFVTDLRNQTKDCAFDKPDERVRDQIVAGIASTTIREKLLDIGDSLTMQKAIEIATTFEATQKQLALMTTTGNTSVDALQARQKTKSFQKHTNSHNNKPCRNCGGTHASKQCPAFGKTCLYCKKKNHFAAVCLQKKNHKRIHNVEGDYEENSDDNTSQIANLTIDTVDQRQEKKNKVFVNVTLGTNDTIRFKIDTGAQVNVIPVSVFKTLSKPPKLRDTQEHLYGYAGQPLDVRGCIDISCSYKLRSTRSRFYIADTKGHSEPVLGLQTCLDLQLIKFILSVDAPEQALTKDTILKNYQSLFTGFGCLEGEVQIHLKPESTPVIHPVRRVPFALRNQLKTELQALEKSGIVSRVTKPTDWVNSLVIVQKPNGNLRICLDPKDLNKAIKRPHYPMPTLEDALSKTTNAKYFSKLDARSGYWQLKLSEESSLLTTFNTPFGRYRFHRLPFGLVSSQDEFQRKMDEVFEGIPGVTVLVDDILITGSTREEHDENLKAALQRATERNLKFNPDKMTIAATEVKYFGHIMSAEGLKPDPTKIKAVKEMATPTNKKELQTLLGMVTYLSKFAPQLSEITQPMRELLKEENEFIWDQQQEEALQTTKQIISSQPVLAFFDPAKPVTLQADASKHGLGATILQEGRPVAFASKSLTPTEQNYAQIEKELYAIWFGCQRFHQYIYGHHVRVESDHKPLESITKKPLAVAPPRLQRMLLQLQKYDLEVIHVPGKDIPVSDTLSRNFLPAEPQDASNAEDLNEYVHYIIDNLPVSDSKMEQLRNSTGTDPQLQDLTATIQDGWPNNRDACKPSTREYWNIRDELSVIDGIIFKGERILVPQEMRPEMLQKIHTCHLGIEKTKQRAREILFWPGMSNEIHQTVAACPICSKLSNSNPKEPMIPHETPSRPWQKLGTDLFTWDGRNFMITVDYYSRYFEVDELPVQATTSKAVIRKLSSHFARHGIPEIVISDNGPQFSSKDFKEFTTQWDFKHITTSPGYPQSNGLAEKTVQTVKRILSKAKADNSNPLLAILEYRCTPVDNLASPAQLLMGRQLRSILPTTEKKLLAKVINPTHVTSRRHQLQQTQKKHYDKSARHLQPLKPGDSINVQLFPKDNWKPAKVINHRDTPRSYTVETEDGGTYCRNRRFLRPRATTPTTPPDTVETAEPEQRDDTAVPLRNSSPGSYRTRSGRNVKPPRRLDL